MKKLLSFALILMVCCSSALIFGGCDTSNGTMTLPTDTVAVTITADDRADEEKYLEAIDRELAKITITVTTDDSTKSFTGNLYDAKIEGASVIGFTLRTDGVKTARVSMYGVSGTFTYKVN